MKVLVACEESQEVMKAFRKLGHDAFSCDLEPCSGGYPEYHIQDDVRNHLNDYWDLMIAHPVCTRLTNAGVRWLKVPPKGRTLQSMWDEFYKGMMLYLALRNAPIKKKALENPIMHIYAKCILGDIPRQIVQPWWFGEPYFKATGFELCNLPELIPTNKLTPPKKGTNEYKKWSLIHRMSPGPERTKLRSKTFPGMAEAMAEQWG